jgi:hypothetical protein
MFLVKLGAKRQIKYILSTEEFKGNLSLIAESSTHKTPHPDTLGNLLKKLSPKELSKIRHKIIARLIRMKCLAPFRLLDLYYMIAIDGTGHVTYKERHCSHCLTKEKDGKVLYYYHNVLEAKIVTENGLALSVETEFIENTTRYTKQDCELKAFYRLVKRLKRQFPQLKICLLLDSLYVADPVFKIIDKYSWKYIITFKEGSMPKTYEEYLSLKSLQTDNKAEIKNEDTTQSYGWVNGISYRGPVFDVLECSESKTNGKGEILNTRFVWVTNLLVSKNNFKKIARGGRLRWKIENEGFNTQKNRGYNLEHSYSKNEVAMKNYYLLLQIAHTISQLMEKGLLKDKIEKVFGSITNVFFKLLEELRTILFCQKDLERCISKPFQIRLSYSPP